MKRKSPIDYRALYFKHNEGKKIAFKKEMYFKCVNCKKWFPKSQITIDHRIPKRKGGTDDLWNLQTMCSPCNLHKSKNNTKGEVAVTLLKATSKGQLGRAVFSIWKRKIKDRMGIKYDRDFE